ncbi:MAG: ATP synthase F1 subunit gamma [Dehalococcoidia bacterium]
MATLRQIKRRIRSIESTAKITRAMELVAASKMRRTQIRALEARPYAEKLRWVMADLAETLPHADPESLHPLLRRQGEVRAVEVVFITPDRGLCGGLPGGLNRRLASFVLETEKPVRVVAVGRKGRDFVRRTKGELVAEFIAVSDNPTYAELRPIAQVVLEDFLEERCDEAYIVFAHFASTVLQQPHVLKLLPVEPPEEAETLGVDYIYEPSREDVLAELLPRYVERQIYGAILEAIASEQSARMVAMRNASENANEIKSELTLVYNKARQETITSELLDITGGVEALQG